MTKRIKSVSIAVALLAAGAWIAGSAEARPSKGGASTSRACLTGSARALLSRIEQKFGKVQIVSTCRPGARIAGTGRISRHASGNAVDFNAGRRKGAIIQWLIATHRSGGTMTYAHMDHIHVDIGPRFVSLGSGGGRRMASNRKWQNRMSLGASSRSHRYRGDSDRHSRRWQRSERRSAEPVQRAYGIDEPKA